MRVLAVDYGTSRIGLAAGTIELKIAMPLCVISATGQPDSDAELVLRKAKELQGIIDIFVVGLPKNMDGSEGKQAELTRTFAQCLGNLSKKPVILQDERLSTFSAANKFCTSAKRRDNKTKKHIKPKEGLDAISAAVILERYFEEIK